MTDNPALEWIVAKPDDYLDVIENVDQIARDKARDRKRVSRARIKNDPTKNEVDTQHQQIKVKRSSVLPFMAVDGEGAGLDGHGAQNYLLMVAAENDPKKTPHVLHRDGKQLSIIDCLEFILSLPKRRILVSFSFGYDVTQIMRHMQEDRVKAILDGPRGPYGLLPRYWGDYAITYQQARFFRVARAPKDVNGKRHVKRSTSRTIYDTFNFFQSSFVKTLEEWQIGSDEEREFIGRNKQLRGKLGELNNETIEYCTSECRSLSAMMIKLRDACLAVDIKLKKWWGAGCIAEKLLDDYAVPRRPLTEREKSTNINSVNDKYPHRPERPASLERAAAAAYFGGRFETTRVGLISRPVFEYDIHSAYPSVMASLPCPVHTRWEHKPRARRLPNDGVLYLAEIMFAHPEDNLWCGFPVRRHIDNGVFCPLLGHGWYWSSEIEAAQRSLRAEIVSVHDLWIAHRECNCSMFPWVVNLYNKRHQIDVESKAMGLGKGRGLPLKLGLNSLYGKMAQEKGFAPYHDRVAAGFITAATRAKLADAIGKNPSAVFMAATDGIYSAEKLPLTIGEELGTWEENVWSDMCIVKSGVYFSPSNPERVKSRGSPRSIIGPAAPRFVKAFSKWFDAIQNPEYLANTLQTRRIPIVPVDMQKFVSCRQAIAWRKFWMAGKWISLNRKESFEWNSKRDAMRIEIGDEHLITYPKRGEFVEGKYYTPTDFDEVLDRARQPEEYDNNPSYSIDFEAMPDGFEDLPWSNREYHHESSDRQAGSRLFGKHNQGNEFRRIHPFSSGERFDMGRSDAIQTMVSAPGCASDAGWKAVDLRLHGTGRNRRPSFSVAIRSKHSLRCCGDWNGWLSIGQS